MWLTYYVTLLSITNLPMHQINDHNLSPVSDTRESGIDLSSPTLATPRTSEFRSHSETEPYLWREPVKHVTEQETKLQFLAHLFPGHGASSVEWNLDLRDLRYDSKRPRKAEGELVERLNEQIPPSSKSEFIHPHGSDSLSLMNPFSRLLYSMALAPT
jgi:hypothetical protein